MWIMVQTGGNQTFIAAVRLVVNVQARLIREFVQQPIQGGQEGGRFEKRKAALGKKIFNLPANISKFVLQVNLVPKILKPVEPANGYQKRVGIESGVNLRLQKLLSNLLDLVITPTEIDLNDSIRRVEYRRQDNILKTTWSSLPKLLPLRQQCVPVFRKKRR